jgi:uncharacterized protein YdeI (BOF family)
MSTWNVYKLTLIFADNMLIFGKYEKEIEEKLNQWNFIIKEYGLRMNMDKTVTIRISKNLHASIRIRVNGTLVKKVDRFIYFFIWEVNSEAETDGKKNTK